MPEYRITADVLLKDTYEGVQEGSSEAEARRLFVERVKAEDFDEHPVVQVQITGISRLPERSAPDDLWRLELATQVKGGSLLDIQTVRVDRLADTINLALRKGQRVNSLTPLFSPSMNGA